MVRRIVYICDNCGAVKSRRMSVRDFNRCKHHFCSKECYAEYRMKHPEEYDNNPYISPQLEKILSFAKIREELYGKREIR